MRDILQRLLDVPGVRGTMVVTQDGMVVESLLGGTLQEEIVGAMAAAAITGSRRHMERAGLPGFDSFTMVSTHGKMIIADTGDAFLVVVLDKNIDLGHARLEIQSAVRKVRSFGEMDD